MLNIREILTKRGQEPKYEARTGDTVFYLAPWGEEYEAKIIRVESEQSALIRFWDGRWMLAFVRPEQVQLPG